MLAYGLRRSDCTCCYGQCRQIVTRYHRLNIRSFEYARASKKRERFLTKLLILAAIA